MTSDQELLCNFCSKDDPFAAVPPKTTVIRGMQFTVEYRQVVRKCWDNLPTATLFIKLDGKRISYNKAMNLLS